MKRKTKRPRRASSPRKKGRKRDVNEIRAYWVGVGICAARHKDDESIFNGKYSKSVVAGYNDDNYHDVSRKVR